MQEIVKKNKKIEKLASHAGGPAFNIQSQSFVNKIPKLNKHGLSISEFPE